MAQFKRTGENPRKEETVKRNAVKNQKPVRKKRQRRKFKAVDVWQKRFGPISEKAVYDVFQQAFNIEPHNMKKYSFPHCVNALRKLENPDYVAPSYTSSR